MKVKLLSARFLYWEYMKVKFENIRFVQNIPTRDIVSILIRASYYRILKYVLLLAKI